jgi:hypothetical protein
MRATLHGLVVVALLLFPREARLSGSSEVELRSRHFAACFESVRKIFGDSGDEQRWHAEWRASARERLVPIMAAIEKEVPSLRRDPRWRLATYGDQLPEVCEAPPAEAPKGPVRCALSIERPFGLRVTVAFERLPSEEARRALTERVAEIVAPFPSP